MRQTDVRRASSLNAPTLGAGHKKVNVRTLDIAPIGESSPQKRSGMARVLKGSHSFTCTPTRSSAIGMSHTCRCLPTYSSTAGTYLPIPERWPG